MQQRVQISPGQTIYKYVLQQPIGGGGYGDVWLAHDRTISRDLAVKVLAQGVTIDERLQEARIGNHLDHANLVKMHYADVVQHNGTDLVIIAMGYLHVVHEGLVRDLYLKLDDSGNVLIENYLTSQPGVFAAGDTITGASLVVNAIDSGRKAAKAIDEYLKT